MRMMIFSRFWISGRLITDYVVSLVLGEEVPHAHIWLIPRHKKDGHGLAINLSNIKKLTEEEMKDAQKKIIESL
jgi:diadenosine tetraphosphate (Ap4A) HIT family hydrolase